MRSLIRSKVSPFSVEEKLPWARAFKRRPLATKEEVNIAAASQRLEILPQSQSIPQGREWDLAIESIKDLLLGLGGPGDRATIDKVRKILVSAKRQAVINAGARPRRIWTTVKNLRKNCNCSWTPHCAGIRADQRCKQVRLRNHLTFTPATQFEKPIPYTAGKLPRLQIRTTGSNILLCEHDEI